MPYLNGQLLDYRDWYNALRDRYNDPFSLLLAVLRNLEPESHIRSVLNAKTVDLMREILSREDYISLAARLDHSSDAKNLLDFMLQMLDSYLSKEEPPMAGMMGRVRRLMLEVISKIRTVAGSSTPHDPNGYTLPLLLYILNYVKLELPAASTLVSGLQVDLMMKVLSRADYVNLATRLDDASDARNLLDLILHILRNRGFSIQGFSALDVSRRARRFMFKLLSKTPVIPPSLVVTGVRIPFERNYIGSGGFGLVLKGELRGKVVALKAFCREALMWRSLRHGSVLPFLGIYEHKDGAISQFFFVSPYMKNGTLARWRKQENPSMDEITKRILGVSQGMEYIHSVGAVHGDLRGENVLLDDDLHVQIADFGLTRLTEATNTRSGALHLNFAAPELFGISEDDDDPSDDPSPRTKMSDVYAFGCLFYEICYDSIPFAGKSDMQILTLIARGALPPRPPEQPWDDEAWDLIQRCWVRDPFRRPTMEEVTASILVEILQETPSPSPTRSSTPSLSTTSRKRQRAYYTDESDDNTDLEFSHLVSPSEQQQDEYDFKDKSLIHAQHSGYQVLPPKVLETSSIPPPPLNAVSVSFYIGTVQAYEQ
ncbi:kinase-like domain-containing protein [Amanita rubescens]|nr:kinase-like domain-containing protein [Amanita rubescens]